jgi:hypothetical protein
MEHGESRGVMEGAGREGTWSRSRGLAWRRHLILSADERRRAPESGLKNMDLRDAMDWSRDRNQSSVYIRCAFDTAI